MTDVGQSEELQVTCIKIEKRLCGALMRQWSPAGMSVETLANDAAREIERLRRIVHGEQEARAHLDAALRGKEHAVTVLFNRLIANKIDVSDLIP